MQSLNLRQGFEEIQSRLNEISTKATTDNILLGVAGCVASGKSRFSRKLQTDVTSILNKEIVYLPFDLWINAINLHTPIYAKRFLLHDFIQAIECIQHGEEFLVPRYDIVKQFGTQKTIRGKTTQEIVWGGKRFVQCSDFGTSALPSTDGKLYVEIASGYLYSLFPSTKNKVFLADGTLVFSTPIVGCYNLRVFINASWPLRVARMLRRFNRKEIFRATTQSIVAYVGFLVEEAKTCADQEIIKQADEGVVLVESMPDSLSNYLDLAYLREYTIKRNLPQWVTYEEIEITMQSFRDGLKSEYDHRRLNVLRQELLILVESKHLLTIEHIDQLLSELAEIIM